MMMMVDNVNLSLTHFHMGGVWGREKIMEERVGRVKASRFKRPWEESWERMGYSTLLTFSPLSLSLPTLVISCFNAVVDENLTSLSSHH